MNIRRLLSYQGRLDRRSYWLSLACLYLLSFVIALLVSVPILMSFGSSPSALNAQRSSAIVGLVVAGSLVWPASMVTTQRLHDFGATGWVCLPILIAFVAFDVLAVTGLDGGPPPGRLATRFADGSTAIAIGALAVIGAIPGARGPNRYGPPV